jgi:hypothetical protein
MLICRREILEILFRLSLTGFLVLVEQGGYLQIVIGTVFALLYLLVHNSYRPFADSGLNVVKSISLVQIVCILYLALISYAEFVHTNDWLFNAIIVLVVFTNIPLELFIVNILTRFNANTGDGKLTFKSTEHNDL